MIMRRADPLPSAIRTVLRTAGRLLERGEGETVFAPGRHEERVYFVESGQVKLVGLTERGEQWTLGLYGSGAFVDVSTWNLTDDHCLHLQAVLPSRVLAIEKGDLLALGRAHPEICELVLESATDQVTMFMEQVLAARSEPVRTRLARLLLDLVAPENREREEMIPLSLSLTHEEMARSVGASRPHTSTVLARMKRDGVVRGNGVSGLRVRPARLQRAIHRGAAR